MMDIAPSGSLEEIEERFSGWSRALGEGVYAAIREAIPSGFLSPGERLRQEALATSLNVSRVPVRTAPAQLEAEGLISFHPRQGAIVRTLNPAQVREIYSLRWILEVHALVLSMDTMTPPRSERIVVLAAVLADPRDGGDRFDARAASYHEISDVTNNPLLVKLIHDLRGRVGLYLLGNRLDDDAHLHKEFVRHVTSGDKERAEAWLAAHIRGAVRKGVCDSRLTAECMTSGLGGSGSD